MKPHEDAELLKKLFPAIRDYQKLAMKHGIQISSKTMAARSFRSASYSGCGFLNHAKAMTQLTAMGTNTNLKPLTCCERINSRPTTI